MSDVKTHSMSEAAEGVVGPPASNSNKAKAFEWYANSAKNGSFEGIKALIKCYDNGVGTPKDETNGFKWCKIAARKHGAEGQIFLGHRFESGKGVAMSLKNAAAQYRKAADSGHTEGMFRLAKVLTQDPSHRQYSSERIVDWYTKAANRGHVGAMYEAGMCYAYGKGETSVCRNSAKEWFKKAAEKGHLEAMCEIGVVSAASDQKEAAAWYAKAADLGHNKGMYELGYCLEQGLGVAKDEVKAVNWYTKAANLNNTNAMRALAACYKNGIGVAKSIEKFIEWSTAASKLGDAKAMYDLGEYYENLLEAPDNAKETNAM